MTFRLGAFDDAFAGWPLSDVLAWYAARGLQAIELGVGGWSRGAHLDVDELLRSGAARGRLRDEVRDAGLALSAINASGNQLHPDRRIGEEHDALFRAAVELAHALEVERVVAMSGCPGGPDGGALPIFAPWAFNCDREDLWHWQLRERVTPYWREVGAWLRRRAPEVRVCLELHPGAFAYNPSGLEALVHASGAELGVNFDPAHFWWQGMDVVTAVETLADSILFVHAKDTKLHSDRIRRNGLLDWTYPPDPERSAWTFASVGDGHDRDAWAALLAALERVGYSGDLSIENEDPAHPGPDGVERSAEVLHGLLTVVTTTAEEAR